MAYQNIKQFIGGIPITQIVEALNRLINDLNPRMVSSISQGFLGVFTVSGLPSGGEGFGQLAYASDALKVGELTGAGTGTMVYFSNGRWRTFSSDQPVQT